MMLRKIYTLRKKEFDILFSKKSKLLNKLKVIDDEINKLNYELNHVGVDKFGAISDFVMLSIHKNYLKNIMTNLQYKKNDLNKQIETINKQLLEKNKQIEQFSYLLTQELKQKLKELDKKERLMIEDLTQAKFYANRGAV